MQSHASLSSLRHGLGELLKLHGSIFLQTKPFLALWKPMFCLRLVRGRLPVLAWHRAVASICIFFFLSFSVYTRNSHLSDVLLSIDKSRENFCELPLFYFGTDGVIFSTQLKLPSVKCRESDRVQSNPLFFPWSPADLLALSPALACFEIPK